MKQANPWPRRLLLTCLVLSSLELIGGITLSIATADGRIIALTALAAGIVVMLGLLWWTRHEAGGLLLRLSFAGSGGLAFYAISTFALWTMGVPLELGVVLNGRMGAHYWLGPVILGYCVATYAALKWFGQGRQR